MAFSKDAPDYNNWEKANNARSKAQSLWLKYRTTDPTKAAKYKEAYSTAKDLQNKYASKVRAYKPPVTTNTNPVDADSKERSDAIIAWQKATGTDTKINKVQTVESDEWTLNTPTWGWATSSGKSNPNTTISWQKVEWKTTYNSVYGWDKVETSNDVNKTDYNKVETAAFNPENGSDEYKKSMDKITAALNYKGDITKIKESAIKTYGSLDAYVEKYNKKLASTVKSWKLTQEEADDISKNFNTFMSSKLGHTVTGSSEAGNVTVKSGGSETVNFGSGESAGSFRIDYDKITKKVGEWIFGNSTFKDNFNTYIDSLKETIQTQREILEGQQQELNDMFKNQEADFQGQFWDIYDGIQKREEETKKMFWDIEKGINQKFEDVEKTMGEQKSGEKAGIEANLRAKGLSEWAISNALAKIDTKYEQSSRSAYSAYQDNLKSLAGEYDKLAANITSAKSTLTQSKLNFSNTLISRSKALIDAAAEFDTKAVSTLTQPLNDMYADRVKVGKDADVTAQKKVAVMNAYKEADEATRNKIISDNMIKLQSQWIKTDWMTNEILAEAIKFDDISKALTFVMEKLKASNSEWTSSSALDNAINKTNDYFAGWTSTDDDTWADSKTDSWSDAGDDVEINKVEENKDNEEEDSTESDDFLDGGMSTTPTFLDKDWNGIMDSEEISSAWKRLPEELQIVLKTRLEEAADAYAETRKRERLSGKFDTFWGTSWLWKDNKTQDRIYDRDSREANEKALEYARKLDKKYPWTLAFAQQKIEDYPKVIESKKEELAEKIAAQFKTMDKQEALRFINNRIGNSPKDIILNHQNEWASYIKSIRDKLNKGLLIEDIIDF